MIRFQGRMQSSLNVTEMKLRRVECERSEPSEEFAVWSMASRSSTHLLKPVLVLVNVDLTLPRQFDLSDIICGVWDRVGLAK